MKFACCRRCGDLVAAYKVKDGLCAGCRGKLDALATHIADQAAAEARVPLVASGSSSRRPAPRPIRRRPRSASSSSGSVGAENVLYYGDNLDILRRYVKDDSVDLVYLDPPFNSNQDYNVLFAEQDGTRSAAQILAFEDTWRWDEVAAATFEEVVVRGDEPVARALRALRTLLGASDMLAYLSMMAPRLVELRRVLQPTGSIYLHCDPTASHYLKVLMDAIFEAKNFRREVVWRSGWVSGFKTAARNWVRNHDTFLYYVRDAGAGFTFNKDLAYRPHDEGYKRRGGGGNPKGVAIDDVWDEVALYSPWIKSFSTEKLGYATQKPVTLLERIISVSSSPGALVLDPFCGCGTAVVAAQKLGRAWIGIDVTHLAIALIKHRLADSFGDAVKYRVLGEPVSVEGAMALAFEDRFQFQLWALGLVDARPSDPKKGADRGIDGRSYFVDARGEISEILLSVKSGGVSARDVRDLRAVLEREGAALGGLITLEPPTGPMRKEAADAGLYKAEAEDRKFPRIQVRTVEELLSGRRFEWPARRAEATFRSAKPAATQVRIRGLFDSEPTGAEVETPEGIIAIRKPRRTKRAEES